MSRERPTMAEMKYHIGLKLPIYPSDIQKKIIKKSINASRFVYNYSNSVNQQLFDLRQIISGFIDPYLTFRTYQRYWINYRRRNRELDGAITQIKSITPVLDSLVKWQLLGGIQNLEQVRSGSKAKYGQYLINWYKTVSSATYIRHQIDFLNDRDIHSTISGNAIRAYQAAWKLWAIARTTGRRNGTPRFKKKQSYGAGSYQVSTTYSSGKPLTMHDATGVRVDDNDHIILPRLSRIRVTPKDKQGRILHAQSKLKAFLGQHDGNSIRIGTTTISKTSTGQYFASLSLGSMKPFAQTLPQTGKSVGIDLNVENFLTMSNGTIISNPKFYMHQEQYLCHYQHKLSRQYRHAVADHKPLAVRQNYQAQRLIVARKLKRVADQRRSFLDNLSMDIIRHYDVIVLEQLQGKNMLKNHALAKNISDTGWRIFVSMLQYKANMYGRTVILVNPAYTTQTCHACGYICGRTDKSAHDKLKLSDREWTCPSCHRHHIRDINAAKNILDRGLEQLSTEMH